MQNCTGDLQEYPAVETCFAMCQRLDNGPTTDLTGNTVECRQNHALLAVSEPAMKVAHCLAAGPLGGAICGQPCEVFCALNLALCVPPTVTVQTYPSGAECLSECATLPYVMQDKSNFVMSDGNTLNCRDYHLQAAYKNEIAAKTHCAHTAIDSSTCN
jgi:hypothetical protein